MHSYLIYPLFNRFLFLFVVYFQIWQIPDHHGSRKCSSAFPCRVAPQPPRQRMGHVQVRTKGGGLRPRVHQRLDVSGQGDPTGCCSPRLLR